MATVNFVQLFKPGEVICMSCLTCDQRHEFKLVLGRTTSIKCRCGQWVGAGHDILILGMERYLEMTLGGRDGRPV